MSRLHSITVSAAEVAKYFGADMPAPIAPTQDITEGAQGMVVFEIKGRRILRAVTWGFPRLTREMRERDEEPGRIGLVADLTNPMWEQMVVDTRYRCLIVLTHFANPAGTPGAMTRTWFSVKGQPIMAWAGFCRNLPDQGPVYAGMTMEANAAIPPTNDRMPVLLDPTDYQRWFYEPIEDVIAFQFRAPFAAERMIIEPTEDLWRSGKAPPSGGAQLALL